MNNELRYGRFTSSGIAALMTVGKDKTSFGKPALTYINDKAMERRLARSLDIETNARPLQWGKCVEAIAFNELGPEYTIISQETIVHPDYDFWSGSPDMIKHSEPKTVCDIKCPYTLRSFCTLVDAYAKGGIDEVRSTHTDGDTYYWQLVSNAILTGCNKAELIVYMPYFASLTAIKDEAAEWGYQWLAFASELELPYLNEGGYYKSINILSFDIPEADMDLLREKVVKANEMIG